MNELTDLFERCASVLAGALSQRESGDDAGGMLATLDYQDGDEARAANRVAVLRAAARLRRLFQLVAPDAPGLVFFGGEADPTLLGWRGSGHPAASLSGTGLSVREAFESCVGEGVEYLSQHEIGDSRLDHGTVGAMARTLDPLARSSIVTLMRKVNIPSERGIAWIAAHRLSDGATAYLPADTCLRRSHEVRDFAAPFKLSAGCGAGVSVEAAALHGLCELIERDAVALWWRGGRRGRAVAGESDAGRAASDLLAKLRGDERQRTSWLLDITTDVGVPCVASLSVGPDGRGFACGHAARPTLDAAARSAVFEMCQMELGQAVIEAKRREGGEAALNEADRTHLRRASLIDAARCALLQPADPPAPEAEGDAPTLQAIVDRLVRMGIEPLAVDLTRVILGIPVVRVVAPGLQVEPSEIISDRLAQMIGRTGGGAAYTGGVALL